MNSQLTATTIFRPCTQSDVPIIQAMVNQLYAADPNTKDLKPDTNLTFLELTRKPDKGRVIVFENGGNVIGYAIIIFFWSNEYGGNIIDVDELFVDEKCRASGLARELFNWLEVTFPENLAGFSLQVGYHNDAALGCFKKIGFSISKNQHLFKILRQK